MNLAKHIKGAAICAAALAAPSAAMALCDVTYKAQQGDTLYSVADLHYGDQEKWTLVYYANQSVLVGPSIQGGEDLFIPCPIEEVIPDAAPLREGPADMTFITGNKFPPFVDENLPGGGMVVELLNAALELTPDPVPYSIDFQDDWTTILFPKVNEKEFDMSFPWYKPKCEGVPDHPRCVNFHFSDPLIQVPIMLFVRADSDLEFKTDDEVLGMRLCRPEGYTAHFFDRPDRRWLENEQVTVVRGAVPNDCLTMVENGEADAAALNLFLGASGVVERDLRGKVLPLERPISEQGIHVVISKRHWRGTSHLYRINAGLKALKKEGRFEEIVARHLELFWAQLQ